MIDVTTKMPLRVLTSEQTRPLIDVPESQLEELTQLLASHGIPFDVDEHVLSLDDEPEMTIVYLGRRVNAAAVQQLLDSVH